MLLHFRPLVGLFVVLAFLGGCTGTNQAALKSITQLYSDQSPNLDLVSRNSLFRYMQVQSPEVLTLTYRYSSFTTQFPDSAPQEVSAWFTGQGEVVRLIDNRLGSSSGLPLNMANTHYLKGANDNETIAIFDVPELGAFNVNVVLEMLPAQPVKSNLALKAASSQTLHWYQERFKGPLPPALKGMPPIVYGLSAPLVKGEPTHKMTKAVYAKQCISPTYCLEWYQEAPKAVR